MICPVPEEQRPINEYLALKESFFFRWATLNWQGFLRVLACIWLGFWLLSGPVAAASFPPQRHLWQFLCLGSLGATLGVCFPLVRLGLGWLYVRDRLESTKVVYEESGWYDGQAWEKPEIDAIKERLLASYEIDPLLHRLRRVGIAVLAFLGIQIAIWRVLP